MSEFAPVGQIKTAEEIKMVNNSIADAIKYGGEAGLQKTAEANSEYTRYKLREDGYARKVIPFKTITNSELTRSEFTSKPSKVIDKEGDSPAAVTVPFGTLPTQEYIDFPRYRVGFCRIESPRFTKDVDELRDYECDVRQIISDNTTKDVMTEEDTKWTAACNAAMGGSAGATQGQTGAVQWQTFYGGVTRDNLQEAFKLMPRTLCRLEVESVVVNNVTIREILKIPRNEMGGDFSEDLFRKGWSNEPFMKVPWYVTIKHELVPEDSIFMFANPSFLGKAFLLESDVTMYVKKEAFMIEFFLYETLGAAIGNVGAVCRADFE